MKHNINGVDFEFSIYNINDAKKFEEVSERMAVEEKKALEILESKQLAKGIQALYDCYVKFFVDLVGVDVIKDLNNALEAQKLVVDFVNGLKNPKEITSINV